MTIAGNIMDVFLLQELACYIFKYLRSKHRAKLMTVNKHFSKYLLETSKALSSYPRAYAVQRNTDCLLDKIYSSGDYHLIVRLKYDLTSLHDLFQVGISCDLDVIKLFMKRLPEVPPYACEILLNAVNKVYNSNVVIVAKWIITKYKTCYKIAILIAMKYDDVDLFNMCVGYAFVDQEYICRYDAVNIVKHSISILNNEKISKHASYNNSLKIMKFMISITMDLRDLYMPFITVCKFGSMEMVKLFIDAGIDMYNLGMINACLYNRIDVIEMMIELGANDWNNGLRTAQTGGSFAAANLMIAHGATPTDFIVIN